MALRAPSFPRIQRDRDEVKTCSVFLFVGYVFLFLRLTIRGKEGVYEHAEKAVEKCSVLLFDHRRLPNRQ